MEDGEGKMMIGMQGETRDRVRDQRIERIVELVSPATLLEELPLGEEREKAVVRGRGEVGNVLDGSDDRLLVVVGPCSVHDVEAALEYAGRLAELSRELERRPADRDAGLLREAADDDRLEGADQRPPPRRLAATSTPACGWRGSCCCRCSTSACRSAASSSTRSRRSTSPTRSPGGRSAPARPRARSTASSAPASRCRSASRTAPTATSRSRSTRSAPRRRPHAFAGIDDSGAPAILYTTGNPDGHVILRGGKGAPNYDAEGVAEALERLRDGRPARAAS